MCRHLAYIGEPRTLSALLLEPPHSLLRQSWAPRHQRHGVVNADGFGAGWYDHSVRPDPARYRTARPMWADRSFASLAGLVRSGAVLAAVRSATPPSPVEESGTPPFTEGPWLFAHNGAVGAYRDGVGARLRASVSERRAAGIEGSADSEILFALTLDALDRGAGAPGALAATVAAVAAATGESAASRLNLLLTDGRRIAATAWGDSLFAADLGGGVVVASEPFDDDPRWSAVPDRTLVDAAPGSVTLTPIEGAR